MITVQFPQLFSHHHQLHSHKHKSTCFPNTSISRHQWHRNMNHTVTRWPRPRPLRPPPLQFIGDEWSPYVSSSCSASITPPTTSSGLDLSSRARSQLPPRGINLFLNTTVGRPLGTGSMLRLIHPVISCCCRWLMVPLSAGWGTRSHMVMKTYAVVDEEADGAAWNRNSRVMMKGLENKDEQYLLEINCPSWGSTDDQTELYWLLWVNYSLRVTITSREETIFKLCK